MVLIRTRFQRVSGSRITNVLLAFLFQTCWSVLEGHSATMRTRRNILQLRDNGPNLGKLQFSTLGQAESNDEPGGWGLQSGGGSAMRSCMRLQGGGALGGREKKMKAVKKKPLPTKAKAAPQVCLPSCFCDDSYMVVLLL